MSRTLKYDDGSVYKGTVNMRGEKHGQGVYTLPSGSTYEGEFLNDEMSGYGVFTVRSGEPEEGDDDDAKPEVYSGKFLGGQFHGKGTYEYSDGARYEGEWCEGEMHGHGRYWEKCTVLVEPDQDDSAAAAGGSGSGGERKGEVPTTLADLEGDYYEGEYRHDQRHGKGLYLSTDGARYEGDWFEGKMHGLGRHVDSKGNTYEGPFENNLMHGKGKMIQTQIRRRKKDPTADAGAGAGGSSGEQETFEVEVVTEGVWVKGNRVDEKGNVIHQGTDPSSNREVAEKEAAAYAEEALPSYTTKRHADSRVRELPDEC
jgi:hypothetical protein